MSQAKFESDSNIDVAHKDNNGNRHKIESYEYNKFEMFESKTCH